MIRLHVHDRLASGASIAATPEQAHYLTAVMRLQPGAALLVFNAEDGEWLARIASAGKRDCAITVESLTRPPSSPPDLDLVMALVKRAALETVIEKATELGVRRIRLVTTRRTNLDHTNIGRLRAIATEAAEQTGRLDVPEVTAPMALTAMLDDWDAGRRLMFCDEAGEDPDAQCGGAAGRAPPALDALTSIPGTAWAVLIGPEGGFAPEERSRLRRLAFVTPVTLGPRILRADTAAISALTLWQATLGDWRPA
jgi:16S rRNA (uracil1498-N3)-methyltransferase